MDPKAADQHSGKTPTSTPTTPYDELKKHKLAFDSRLGSTPKKHKFDPSYFAASPTPSPSKKAKIGFHKVLKEQEKDIEENLLADMSLLDELAE